MAGRHAKPRRGASSLVTSASGAFVLQSTGAGLNLAMQSSLAHVLGTTLFGQYSLAFNLSQLIATPADLGASSSVTRFIPQYRVLGQRGHLRGVLLAAQLVPLVVASLVAGAAAAVVAGFGAGSAPVAVMLIAIAGIPLFVLSLVQMNMLRALGHIFWAFAPMLVLQPLVVLIAVVLLAPRSSLVTYAWVTVGALGAVVITSTCTVGLITRRLGLNESPRILELRHWWTVSLPMLLINVVQLVFQRLDIVAVAVLLDARSAGIYAIANRMAVAAASLQKAMLSIVAPQMSGLHWSGRSPELERLVLRGLRLVFVPALLVTAVLAVAGGEFLGLVGEPYRAGYAALVVYALGQLISVGAGPVGWLATIVGEERSMARINTISAVLAVVGYAVLIPTIGIVGAAASNSAGIAYRNVAASRLARRHGYHISLVRAFRRPAHA
ncbi:MAG: hypothetical protein DLM57_18525 [Pseudonocardiales bacterium]|nr:MAG: hypothetical protein DLM57_18525 [Pseudonocardiales bacterium]